MPSISTASTFTPSTPIAIALLFFCSPLLYSYQISFPNILSPTNPTNNQPSTFSISPTMIADMGTGIGRGVGIGITETVNAESIASGAQKVGYQLFKGGIDGLGETFNDAVRPGGSLDKGARNSTALWGRTLGGFGNEIGKQSAVNGDLYKGVHSANTMALDAVKEWNTLFLRSIRTTALIVIVTSFAYFIFKYGIRACFEHIERKMRKPILLKQMSQGSPRRKRLRKKLYQQRKLNMMLTEKQQKELGAISKAITTIQKRIKAKAKNITYRNLLLFGPPGTGKTMFAEQLARETGMSFAILSGSALSQFRHGTAIAEINHLFSWAENNKHGTIIFIDEIDALLPNRDYIQNKDSEEYKNICEILSLTGTRSSKFMLIMTTNKNNNLDGAIESRVDDEIEMGLPDEKLRKKLIDFYVDKIFFDIRDNGAEFVEHARTILTDTMIDTIAQKTDGYEHRKIHSFINILFSNTLSTDNIKITPEIIDDALESARLRQIRKAKKT